MHGNIHSHKYGNAKKIFAKTMDKDAGFLTTTFMEKRLNAFPKRILFCYVPQNTMFLHGLCFNFFKIFRG